MTAPNKLAHVVFRTNQLDLMKNWYCDVLEAEVVFANPKIAFLTYDREHHRIALIATEDFAPRAPGITVGFYHAAFAYETLRNLLDTFDRLAVLGILPTRTINHGPTTSFYYSDPDRNEIELQVDRFAGDPERAKLWMQGEAFTRNPIGILVDPAELRRKLEDGVPVAKLMCRADETEGPN